MSISLSAKFLSLLLMELGNMVLPCYLVLLMRLNLLSDVSEVKPSQLGFLFVSRVFVSFYHLPFRGS